MFFCNEIFIKGKFVCVYEFNFFNFFFFFNLSVELFHERVFS